ncbi:MAG TPA: hypothetical protein DFL85_03820 [Lentisphaeria bacterium]|nr:hypothetical protein [Lentisphaeria bacterium]HCH84618.1 hypothetical protein [Lentisphaeria bacterium]
MRKYLFRFRKSVFDNEFNFCHNICRAIEWIAYHRGNMIQPTMKNPLKHRQVFDYLCEAIEAGIFVPGRRLPSERMLAEELEVNVATVRRAFRDLIAGGVVEKRVGDGTYICVRPKGPRENIINFILSNYEGDVQRELVKLAVEEGKRLGVGCRISYAGSADLVMQIRTFLRFRQPTVILGDSSIGEEAIREIGRAPGLFVVIANRLDHLGIPSVIGNDYAGINILVHRLRELGHRSIALLHNNSGHPIENTQIAVWKSCCPEAARPELEFRANVPSGEHPAEYAYEKVLRSLPGSGATALIALNDELAVGALSAAAELGRPVPASLSVVSIGDSVLGRFATPPLTELNPNLPEHLRQAFSLLRRNQELSYKLELLRIVEPELVERRSTAPCVVAERMERITDTPLQS